MFELANGPIHYNHEDLASLLVNPFSDLQNEQTDFDRYIDPDINHVSANQNCKYYIEDQFNHLIEAQSASTKFSCLHLNTRSLLHNFDQFKTLIDNLTHHFKVIGISETWLDENSYESVNVPGYNFISNYRTSKKGGGTGIYLQESLEYKIREDCNFSKPDTIESVFAEISIPHEKNIIVGTIYRPPSQNLSEFNEIFARLLNIITKENKCCYLMGDFNLNLLKQSSHAPTDEFLETLFSHGLFPLITKPTRLTSHSATLIDNILTNYLPDKALNGLIINDISDHLPVFTVMYDRNPTRPSKEKIYRREFKQQNITNFQNKIQQCDWKETIQANDPNLAYESFLKTFSDIYSTCFPVKCIQGKPLKKILNPWMTKGLLKSVNRKNRLYKMTLRNPSVEVQAKYKKYKNKLNHCIRLAKKNYYAEKIAINRNNMKSTWNTISEVLNRRKSKKQLPSIFKLADKLISDPSKIANKFCDYFTNIGPNLADKIPSTDINFDSFLKDRYEEPVGVFKPATPGELETICQSLQIGKSPGFDNISTRIVKISFNQISNVLLHIINLSLSTGIFPDKLKIAKIIPIYKSDESDQFKNYRPISILPCFSKFFEKVIYNRITAHLDKLAILYDHQYGFRKNRSTCTALIHLINKLACDIDNQKVTAGVFLDLSKAFDTINHSILISKLNHYGIQGNALKLIKNYVSDRKQFVKFRDQTSNQYIVRCGVPQGSILGPLLFILYINDLPNASSLIEPILFADDTSIFYSHKDLNQLILTLNSELDKISTWMKANKLSVNLKKTNYILFRPSQKKIPTSAPVLVDNQIIQLKQRTKFLGIYIDENLTWKTHVNYICSKISKTSGIIYKARYYLTSEAKLSIYYALVYPYITYCNIIWSSTYPTTLNRLFLLQKRVVRSIENAEFHAHSAPIFRKLKILDIFSITAYNIGHFMFLYHNNFLPSQFCSMFQTNSNVHTYSTRTAHCYRTHFCRTNIKKQTILFQGPKLWNSLPIFLTSQCSFKSFKRKFIDLLLLNQS